MQISLYCLLALFISCVTAFWYLTYHQEELHGQIKAHTQKLIVFDFDGTLCDSLEQIIQKYNEFCPNYNLKPVDTIASIRDVPLQKFFEMQGITPWKLPLIKYKLIKAVTPQIPNMHSFQGIHAILVELKNRGYTLGILTSNSYKNVSLFLENEHINLFDFIYCGSNIFGKARLLTKIKSKAKPSEMFYVGDEHRDIEAAKEVDITSVAVTWGFQSEWLLSQYTPSYLVRSRPELLKIFAKKT